MTEENQQVEAANNTPVLITEKNYFQDRTHLTFSALKVFSKCETLYREVFIAKTYNEPDRDYFIYGSLVDAILTETPEFVKENFILVSSKVSLDDALKYENKKQEVLNEMEEVKKKDDVKMEKLVEKLKEANEKEAKTDSQKKAKDKKLIKLNSEIKDLESNPSSTVVKGLEVRQKKIDEFDQKLLAIKEMGNKSQVTKSIWKNAEETALAIKTHPYWTNLDFNPTTSQQIITAEIDGIPMKGKLDHLRLSPQVEKIYKMYKAKMIARDEMQNTIHNLPYESKHAIITDIKSHFNIEKIEPYNNHYRGQLGFYQNLVSAMLMIPIENIKCQIFVGDKVSSEFKRSEIFIYAQETLDELKGDVKEWSNIWRDATALDKFTSAKAKWGIEQKCFTCSECRMAPFSQEPGVPVLVTGPRFKTEETSQVELNEMLIDY